MLHPGGRTAVKGAALGLSGLAGTVLCARGCGVPATRVQLGACLTCTCAVGTDMRAGARQSWLPRDVAVSVDDFVDVHGASYARARYRTPERDTVVGWLVRPMPAAAGVARSTSSSRRGLPRGSASRSTKTRTRSSSRAAVRS